MGLTATRIFFIALLLAFIFERLLELRSAKRNTARLLAADAREFGAGHYQVVVAMHVAFFASFIVEFILRDNPLPCLWYLPFALLVLAQLWRAWSRVTMGDRWTARIIAVPGERLVASGPFKLVRHPIYVSVVLELFSLPLVFGLYVTCIVFTMMNAVVLLRIRIPEENSALAWSQNP